MRLIDVRDFIKNKLSKYDLPSDSINACDIRLLLLEQPTVDTIPIEWLRERASRMLDFGEGIERIIQEWKDEQSK